MKSVDFHPIADDPITTRHILSDNMLIEYGFHYSFLVVLNELVDNHIIKVTHKRENIFRFYVYYLCSFTLSCTRVCG